MSAIGDYQRHERDVDSHDDPHNAVVDQDAGYIGPAGLVASSVVSERAVYDKRNGPDHVA